MFVLMNVGNGGLLGKYPGYATYKTLRAAETACTKLNKQYGNNSQWQVMTLAAYQSHRQVP